MVVVSQGCSACIASLVDGCWIDGCMALVLANDGGCSFYWVFNVLHA